MRSKEFITEKGPGGGAGSPGRPAMTDAQRAAQAAQGEENWQGIKNWWNNAPQTGGTAVPGAQDPAQRAGQGVAAPADITLPQTQRTRFDPNSLNQTADADAAVAAAVAAATADRLRKPIGTTEPAPAAAPAAVPAAAPAAVPAAAPAAVPAPAAAPSFNVPGAAHSGQQGSNYTTGVEQDRPSADNAGVDQTLRGDHPFNGIYPGQDKVTPVQSPVPRPATTVTTDPNQRIKRQSGGARKPWGTVKDKDGRQVYIDNDGGKWVMPPNTSAWKPANMVPGSDVTNKALPTTTGYTPPVQGATPAATGPVSTGRQPWEHTPPAPDPVQVATPVPAPINRGTNTKYKNPPDQGATPATAGSVVVKSGDTLSKIAAANGTTVQAIMAANPSIKDANRIAAGQTVKLRESSDVARIRHLAGLTRN